MDLIYSYIASGLRAMLVLLPFVCVCRLIACQRLHRHGFATGAAHELAAGFFLLFLGMLLSFTVDLRDIVQNGFIVQGSMNIQPFLGIGRVWNTGNGGYIAVNILGNILIFAPVGFFLPLLWRKFRHWWAAIGLGMLLSLVIEFSQLFTVRECDIDDLLLNTAGALVGYLCYKLLRAVGPHLTDAFLVFRQTREQPPAHNPAATAPAWQHSNEIYGKHAA